MQNLVFIVFFNKGFDLSQKIVITFKVNELRF